MRTCLQADMRQEVCQIEAVSLGITSHKIQWLSWMSGLSWHGLVTGPLPAMALQLMVMLIA